ncbi:MAG TPA: 16S rRNA (adenine(1518)-N(6)/adenine(1519)-N(6))-dimethyltransferase RsmA [Aggregatilineales bacterium]|nr:16S rRNA (adenine(1518)-N(6)/adenine(1519)-N(6))-dimethyltransferase RsmA [Aggregatilineales bacterium]
MNPKFLLDTRHIDPKKSLGQNFLHDPNALEKIVETAGVRPTDYVLEIGPGTGALTVYLAQSAARVIAIEIDQRLIPILEDQVRDFGNVQIIHADILETHIPSLIGVQEYVVVGNLPYYITSAILRHLLEVPHKPRRLVVTIQQEVADRLVAPPGDMSLLAISVLFYGQPRIVTRLPPAAFWPRPEVASAVVQIDVYPQPRVEVPDETTFFKVVRAGFGQKRKQLKNSMGAGLGLSHPQAASLLEASGVDPMRRAETLTLEEWAAVTRTVVAASPEQF